jgi:membrane protein implicated in regulation of membrane protease activity
MTFFFTIGNSVMSLATDDQNTYWWQSIVSYGLLALVGGGIAYLVSGDSMDVYGSYKWLYFMFAIGHIFFLALIRTMRKIVSIAKEQDGRLRGED